MTSHESKKIALERLAGKWGTVIGYTMLYGIIIYVLSLVAVRISEEFGSLISTIIEVPLSLGFIICMLKLFDSQNTTVGEIFTEGFNNFGRSWSIVWYTFLKLILPIIVFVISIIILIIGVSGAVVMDSATALNDYSVSDTSNSLIGIALIGFLMMFISMIFLFIKSFKYKLANYIAADNPEMSGKEAVNKSEELMTGRIGSLIWLELSFIGWAILSCLTLGIGFIWLVPYIQFSEIAFYRGISGDVKSEVSVAEYDDSENTIE